MEVFHGCKGSSNYNGTIMEAITSVPPLTYAQKGGLHQQKVERNKKKKTLNFGLAHVLFLMYNYMVLFKQFVNWGNAEMRSNRCSIRRFVSRWRFYLLMILLQEVKFLFQTVQVTTECGDDLVMVWLGFLQGHTVPLHRLTHHILRLPSASTHQVNAS